MYIYIYSTFRFPTHFLFYALSLSVLLTLTICTLYKFVEHYAAHKLVKSCAV